MKEQLLVYFVEQQQNLLQEENSTVGFHSPSPVRVTPSEITIDTSAVGCFYAKQICSGLLILALSPRTSFFSIETI